MEQLRDLLLAAPQRRTRQCVGVDLHEARLDALDDAGDLARKAARQRRLAGAGRPGQHDEPVNRHRFEREFLPQLQGKHGLRQHPLAHGVGELDRVPRGGEIRARQVGLIDNDIHELKSPFVF
jgi:hypothetical protein